MMPSQDSTGRPKMIAYISLMTALSAILGYLEQIIPVSGFSIPGLRLGLANTVSLLALYLFGAGYAYVIMILRILMVGFMFGNMYSIFFSLAGGLLSMTIMYLLKKTGRFTMTGISAAGGACHNVGQLLIAALTLNEIDLSFYIPLLLTAGTIAGFVIGILCSMISERLFKIKESTEVADDRISQRNN